MLFVLRTQNLIRGIHAQLGGSQSTRLITFGKYALKGLYTTPSSSQNIEIYQRVSMILNTSTLGGNQDVDPGEAPVVIPELQFQSIYFKGNHHDEMDENDLENEGAGEGMIGRAVRWFNVLEGINTWKGIFHFMWEYWSVRLRIFIAEWFIPHDPNPLPL